MRLEQEIKMRKFRSPHARALLNIVFTNYWLGEQMGGLLKAYDLSEQQFNVLRILRGQKGKPINLMDIQGRMLHKMSNATRLVEKLRIKGLVERVQCEMNRRKVEITITDRGLKILEELDPILEKNEKKVFKSLSDEEAIQLSELLDKLRG